MTSTLRYALREHIDARRAELSVCLGLDLADVPDHEAGPGPSPYPELSHEELTEITRGYGRDILARTLDHSLLKPEATPEQILALCDEALAHCVAAVCVNGAHVALAASRLAGTGLPVAAVVGFPLGQASPAVKVFEARRAWEDGAGEIDMVLNVGCLKAGRFQDVVAEIQDVTAAVPALVKVIIETALLSRDEIIDACILARFGQAAFVKTSTGFSSRGATVEDVALMRAVVGRGCGVKASGGIRTRAEALAMLSAGANRIGTSHAVSILRG